MCEGCRSLTWQCRYVIHDIDLAIETYNYLWPGRSNCTGGIFMGCHKLFMIGTQITLSTWTLEWSWENFIRVVFIMTGTTQTTF